MIIESSVYFEKLNKLISDQDTIKFYYDHISSAIEITSKKNDYNPFPCTQNAFNTKIDKTKFVKYRGKYWSRSHILNNIQNYLDLSPPENFKKEFTDRINMLNDDYVKIGNLFYNTKYIDNMIQKLELSE